VEWTYLLRRSILWARVVAVTLLLSTFVVSFLSVPARASLGLLCDSVDFSFNNVEDKIPTVGSMQESSASGTPTSTGITLFFPRGPAITGTLGAAG